MEVIEMAPKTKPTVSLSARVPLTTDERRRRLQDRTGRSLCRLVDDAFRALETELDRDLDGRALEAAN
jgi:hypothetical protein